MRTSKMMMEQAHKLREEGHSLRKIAMILKLSRNTVRRILRSRRQENDAASEEVELEEARALPCGLAPWTASLPWKDICQQRQAGVTAKVLFQEFAPAVDYSTFCRQMRKSLKPLKAAALRLPHTPAEKAQIDFCKGLELQIPGQMVKTTQFFCGVLPFSGLVYGQFVLDQKLETFIRCQESMWIDWGGVTRYVVMDNLKAAVNKAHCYDPDLNPTYVDYANHAGFAPLPARPYTPRDKAAVESAIGVIQKSFFQECRQKVFSSLFELNQRFREYLAKLNSAPMREYGVSRLDRFAAERDLLGPVPKESYEIIAWQDAKVHPDCCIQVKKNLYSVPFGYIGQTVRVKLSSQLIWVYSSSLELIANHVRLHKQGAVSIEDKHLPPLRMHASSFELNKARAEAAAIGPATKELVEKLLGTDSPLAYLRRIQGILRLLKQGIPASSLDYGCSQALTFARYRVAYIRECALQHMKTGGQLTWKPPIRDLATCHLHGDNHV